MLIEFPCSGGSISLPRDELVEPSGLSAGRLVLMEEGELRLLEHREERLPVDFLEARVRLPEVDAQDATRVAAVGHTRGATAALLGPAADGLVIGGRGAAVLAHAHLL
jgi:hypothetical protein